MPYTPCHMALMLPIARRPLIPSALAIGAMTPDIEYFLSCSLSRDGLHVWPTGLLMGLPLGMALLFLWHVILKLPLFMLLPESHQRRLVRHTGSFSFGPLSRFCLILISLILGIASHILWDAFTHADGWFVQRITILQGELIRISGWTLTAYGLLQILSSFVGGVVLCAWYAGMYMRHEQDRVPSSVRLTPIAKGLGVLGLLSGTGLPAFVRLLSDWDEVIDLRAFTIVAGRAAITGLTCGFLVAIGLSVLLHYRLDIGRLLWTIPSRGEIR